MLTVKNVSKKYGKHKVLTEVSFEIVQGECIGMIGANGSGKSTLLGILSGTLKCDSGIIMIFGKDAWKQPSVFAEHVGYVPQGNPLLEDLTVKDNLKIWYSYGDCKGREQEIKEILVRMDLLKVLSKKTKKLSGGMKRRLSLACALITNPQLLILDEPGAALDFAAKKEMYEYLKQLKKEGKTIIMATHEKQDLDLCDRVFLLSREGIHEVTKAKLSFDELLHDMESK